MSKWEEPKRKSFAQKLIEDENIISREVQFIDDPKNSDALAKIHEMSNKAKKAGGKSPSHMSHIHFKDDEQPEKNQGSNHFMRRTAHFATVKPKDLNILKDRKPFEKENKDSSKYLKKNSNNNLNNFDGNDSRKKGEYVWDKSINRLVEKNASNQIEKQPGRKSLKTSKDPELTNQPKREDKYKPKIEYKTQKNEIKEEAQKEEKEEIIEKLKNYRKKDEGYKKKISYKIPKGNSGKYSEVVYEKNIIKDDGDEFEKEISNSNPKNTKFFKKVIKNEPGSKVVITKRVIEESSEQTGGEKLHFDDDSDDDLDIEKEFKDFNIKPSEFSKQNVKVKVITEEYDEKGNKIYSREYTSNKLPKNYDKFD